MSWRDVARPIIARVLRENRGEKPKRLRAALFRAYPFGERWGWPYKVWCDEIRVQRGLHRTRKKRPKKTESQKARDARACPETRWMFPDLEEPARG